MSTAEADRRARALALDAIKHAPRVRGDHAVLRALRAANEIESDPALVKAGYNPRRAARPSRRAWRWRMGHKGG